MNVEKAVGDALRCNLVEVLDESHFHGKIGTHYKLTVVSEEFSGMDRIARHRKILSLLQEFERHALSLHLYTPEEWKRRSASPPSPKCIR